MTNHIFISYSKQQDERRVLRELLREHGLRPWRDVEDLLAAANTQRDIEAELADCQAVVLWLSNEIFESDFVKTIKLPEIRAAVAERAIRVLPIFDSLTVDEANTKAKETWGFSVSEFNGYKLDRDGPIDVECAVIANSLVRSILSDAARSDESPIVRAVTRDDTADHRTDSVLNFDWRHDYAEGALPDSDAMFSW
jgi:hypothetical protein